MTYLKTFNRVLGLIHINLTLHLYAKYIKDYSDNFMYPRQKHVMKGNTSELGSSRSDNGITKHLQ